MEKIYNSIIRRFVENKLISEDEYELYIYATKVLFSTIVNFATTILIATILRIPFQGIVFFSVFFLLRKFTGGFHSKSSIKCYVFSTITTFILFFAIRSIKNNIDILVVANKKISFALGISVVIIFLFSPFENKNKPLTKKEKKIYRIIAFCFALISVIICVILMFKKNFLFFGVASAIIFTAMLLLFSVFGKFVEDYLLCKKMRRNLK